MTNRNYSNTALDTTLAGGIDASATTLSVASATGFPAAPFAVVLDPGSLTSEEIVLVTAKSGTSWTVTRGYDGTAAAAHGAGTVVRHSAIAADFTDLQSADATNAAAIVSEATTRAAADTAEASTRASADSTLQANIDAEASARAAADALLLAKASNLSDVANAGTARTNLGLGTAATKDTGTGAGNVILGNDSRLTDSRTPTAHASSHASAGSDPLTLSESQITNLVSDLAAKAPLASPTFTGTPAAPTPSGGDNTTKLATTAYVQGEIASKAPTTRQLTINGTAFDLSADRSWTIQRGQGMTTTTADSTGATDATSQLQTDLTTASAAAHKRLYIPAGTYKLAQVGGTLFSMTTDDVEVFGDGIGKTILQVPASTVLTSDLIIFQLKAKHQWLHDFSIQIGAGASGAFDMHAIQCYQDSYYPRLTRIEISGVYGNGTAGGAGIETYQPYNRSEVSTTLGTTIASGTRTVTPPSMAGIYAGRTLTIGGSTETIQVTSITETTFTATFANAHNASDTVLGTSNARQYALIEDCIVRDSYKCSAFVVNSAANEFRRCIALHVGSNSTQHGFYVQAGQNEFLGCRAEGVGGYSYHQHIATTVTDASGNRYIGCESIDPGTQHLIADGSASDGTNPDVPNTAQLARYTVVANCLFRRTKGAAACSGVRLDYGGIVQGCMFEDPCGGSGSAWLFGNSGGTGTLLAVGNVFRMLNTGNTGVGIIAYATSIVTGNQFINWSTNTAAIRVDGACTLQANAISMSNGIGIMLNAGSVSAFNNLITASGGTPIVINNPSLSNINFKNNEIVTSGSVSWAIDFQGASFMPTASVFANNRWTSTTPVRYYDAPSTLQWINNKGPMAFRGNATQMTALDEAGGRLLAFPKSTNTLTSGLLVKISSGALATLATTDTSFFGVATSTTDSTSAGAYIIGDVGAEVPGVACDGAWTAGNIGIASTTSAGKIHDSGLTTAPASGSYVLFLDTGGSAGNARCLILKTL